MSLFDIFKGKKRIITGNLAYYPGCLTRFVGKDLEENYICILDKLGLDFIVVDEIKCCGSPALNNGYRDVFNEQIVKNKDYFKARSISKIVTNCPSCYYMFSKIYPQNKDWDSSRYEINHTVTIIYQNLNKLKVENKLNLNVTFHDPCHLGRSSKIYDEPREILKYLGCNVTEMEYSRERSFCCGGGAGLRTNNKELANRIAKKRVEQALDTKAEALVTACPMCYLHLKENNSNPKFKVYELSQLILKSIKR